MNCGNNEDPARWRWIAALGLACASTAAQGAPAEWPANLTNPAAQAGDVVLPMPCGGSMAFRRVDVPSADALDDRRVQLGSPEPRFAYVENTRSEYVGGGFVDPSVKNQHYYLMGKYEVTQLQYDAMMSATRSRLARTGRTLTRHCGPSSREP